MAISSLTNSHADLVHLTSHNVCKGKSGDELETKWSQKQKNQPNEKKCVVAHNQIPQALRTVLLCKSLHLLLAWTMIQVRVMGQLHYASFLAVTCACFLLHLVLCMKIHALLRKRLTKGIIAHMNHQLKIYHFPEFNKNSSPKFAQKGKHIF